MQEITVPTGAIYRLEEYVEAYDADGDLVGVYLTSTAAEIACVLHAEAVLDSAPIQSIGSTSDSW
jgi:hypothetical protein